MSKLPNVKGKISYISSKARQENLYAVYETTDRKFWTELARCNQEEFKKSGTEGTCIEARELIIALPESFVDYEPDKLLKLFTEYFKQNYGVYLPTKKIGKNNPKAEQIKTHNQYRTMWNQTVDRALISGVPER